jgi:acetyl-CoA acetyltransferase
VDRTPVIVGAADYPIVNGVVEPGVTAVHIQAAAAAEALRMAGLTFADVDGLLTAGAWSLAGAGQHPTFTLGEYMRIRPRFIDSTNIGGASFEAHLAHAAAAIAEGRCDVALITYGSTQRSDSSRSLGGRAPEHNFQFETPWGMPSPLGGYALAAARYEHQYGDIRQSLSEVAVAARAWAALNPRATKRELLTVDEVSESKLISDPLRLLDCCLVTDGGGAVVVTAAGLAGGVHRPIQVTGYGEAQTHWIMSEMPDLTVLPAAESGPRALSMAGRRADEIDIVQLYDSFTITVLLTLEAMGFCAPGEGADFIRDNDLRPGGDIALNTSGGGLSYLHPGMFGIFLITEACRQLWGEAGDAQVEGCRTALVSGTGGTMSSAATCVLELS